MCPEINAPKITLAILGRTKYHRRGRAGSGNSAGLANSNSLVVAVLFIVLTLAVLGLTYFAISLQGKIAALTLTLEPGRTSHFYLFDDIDVL